jgi:uncharacterized membrane protein YfcA
MEPSGMLSLAWLSAASLAIGFMVGATGIGGFLIISVLAHAADMPIRAAMGTALVIAAANGALGAWLFLRRGNIDWSVALPMAGGAIGFALLGGWLNRWLPVPLVVFALGGIMIAGSLSALWREARVPRQPQPGGKLGRHAGMLVLIGCLSGLAAGLTGAGGPLVSVPLLAILGYPVLTAVGASQVLQLAASISGAIPYWQENLIAIEALLVAAPIQLLGIWMGVRLVHAIDQKIATRIVACIGIAAGLGFLWLAMRQ